MTRITVSVSLPLTKRVVFFRVHHAWEVFRLTLRATDFLRENRTKRTPPLHRVATKSQSSVNTSSNSLRLGNNVERFAIRRETGKAWGPLAVAP